MVCIIDYLLLEQNCGLFLPISLWQLFRPRCLGETSSTIYGSTR